jgi:acyl-CoA dehydrogenase
MAPHPIVELTSEASWGLVCSSPPNFPHLLLTNGADRRQVLAICEGDSCQTYCILPGENVYYDILHSGLYLANQNDILPSIEVAHAQVPSDPETRWKTVIPVIEELKVKARKIGLWNLFLSKTHYPEYGVPLTNLEV